MTDCCSGVCVAKVGSTVVVLARVAGIDGVNITQSSLHASNGLQWRLVEEDGTEIQAWADLTVSDAIFNTLQTFSFPSGGTFSYNFKHVIASTFFETGNISYEVQYKFKDTQSYYYTSRVTVPVEGLL